MGGSARKLIVVDDDPVDVRFVMRAFSDAGSAIEITHVADAELASDRLDREAFDYILLDINMPGTSGMDLLKRLKQGGSALQVIVMTGHGDVPLAVEAMRIGAADFIEKPFDDEMFIASVRMAIARQKEADHDQARKSEVQRKIESLSARERQVLEGLVAGNPNKRIAYDLGISPRTVEIYRANLMTKMQAGSLSDLVRMALLAGSLPEPGDA